MKNSGRKVATKKATCMVEIDTGIPRNSTRLWNYFWHSGQTVIVITTSRSVMWCTKSIFSTHKHWKRSSCKMVNIFCTASAKWPSERGANQKSTGSVSGNFRCTCFELSQLEKHSSTRALWNQKCRRLRKPAETWQTFEFLHYIMNNRINNRWHCNSVKFQQLNTAISKILCCPILSCKGQLEVIKLYGCKVSSEENCQMNVIAT